MVAIRFSGTDEDSHMPGLADDALDEQDAGLVYGNCKLTPKGQELVDYMRSVDYTKGQDELQRRLDAEEQPNYFDFFAGAAVGVLLLALGFISWRWIW